MGCYKLDTLTKIQELLKSKGLMQKDLTAHLGLSQVAFTDWKRGRSDSYLKYLPLIAEYLDCSADYLLGRTDEQGYKEKAPSPEGPEGAARRLLDDAMDGLSVEELRQLLGYAESLRSRRNPTAP